MEILKWLLPEASQKFKDQIFSQDGKLVSFSEK